MRLFAACLLLSGLVACTAANSNVPSADASHAGAPLPFIQDDYARALAEAKAKGIPLFVDVWAPWCHTCRSMKAYVLSDASLARHADRFVWLEVNTDLTSNAAFQEQYPVEFWPTLYVIDPRQEKALLRFAGSATVAQLEKLFEDGERAYKGGITGAEALLARGDALYAEGRSAEAAETLAEALTEAPADWSRRGRAVESLLTAMYGAKQHEDCARKALEELPKTPRSLSWANGALLGMYCVLSLPEDAASGTELREGLEAKVAEALAPPAIDMSADDRSGLYEVRVQAREAAKDAATVKALSAEWLTFLEAEAAKAPNPQARTVFDSHRMLAAMKLETPGRAIPAIEQSEKDLPQDYNPPARLATLYRLEGRLDDALAASERALARVQGARRLSVLSGRADIFVARKDTASAVKTLEEAITFAKTLPASQVSPRMVAGLEKKLTGLQSSAR
ncbi:Thioredoxin domain-containing protein EC-YbbN [Myxococcus hansupus]|uniref:Thioredoxin domain-containing protein EC-YbbN n=1 Tax=Pseudomyxococcus hansupus TaxID=1297742 RepID=A0A0H4XQV4_9BACT|nr:thioredoxin family protein [Myxococcus hansupus]AKQ70752.1 Thioredoxin domain-containing protein EC-YbbN [Myxococcus hansupus]